MFKIRKIKDKIRQDLQILHRGYSSEDIWALDYTIAKFILPRLIAFRAHPKGYPYKSKGLLQWNKILDEMIFAFDYYANHYLEATSEKDGMRIDRGMDLFAEYFHDLWI